MTINIRKAKPSDNQQLQLLAKRSFGSAALGVLHQLYNRGEYLEFLVAEDNGVLVGAQAVAVATITYATHEKNMDIGALISISIQAERIHDGIQYPLIQSALDFCYDTKLKAAVVASLYPCYQKFGFKSACTFGIKGEAHIPADALMINELEKNAVPREPGIVKYQLSQLAF